MKKDKPVKAEEVRAKIKRLVQETLQDALEGELDEFMGYPKHQSNGSDNARNGHSAKTIQTNSGPMEIEVPRDRKSDFQPKLIRKRQTVLDDVEEICSFIRDKHKNIPIIIGGQLLYQIDYSLLNSELIDYVYFGDVEGRLPHFLSELLSYGIIDFNNVFEVNDLILSATNRSGGYQYSCFNSDSIPDYSLVEKCYVDFPEEIQCVTVETVRGCYHKCAFCSYHKNHRYTNKSVDLLLEELSRYQKMGVKNVIIMDSLFTSPQKRCRAILDAIIENEFNFNFGSFARVDDVSEDLAKRMKEAGCKWTYLGVESANDRILNNMRKGLT